MKFKWDDVDHIIELPDVYDGWSVAVLKDGSVWNRWSNDTEDGPLVGYERRYAATQRYITENLVRP